MHTSLLPLSWMYSFAMDLRNTAFDRDILKRVGVSVPVISVGNLSVGGTGKTPLVEYLVEYCVSRGIRPAVVSRGYKRVSKGVVVVSDGTALLVNALEGGDEPVQVARKFPEAVVVVGERRVDAARVAVEQLDAHVVILDDGFQHRYLRRDLDILVMDSRKDLRREPTLPAGMMRERWSGIGRAGLVALSRVAADESPAQWKRSLGPCYAGPIIMYRYKTDHIRRAYDQKIVPFDMLKSRHVVAFSGIGDHDGFLQGIRKLGFTVEGERKFPDHHVYTEDDTKSIVRMMETTDANGCVTTEKDVMRLIANPELEERFLKVYPVYYTTIIVDVLWGRDTLDTMVQQCIERKVV